MTSENIDQLRDWYSKERPRYESMSDIVRSTIEILLRNADIEYLSVTARVKAVDSFVEKVRRKSYKDAKKDMTDLVGIRIITFIEADIDSVSKIIQESFHVHNDKSLDKTSELGIDRIGYRSVHFVCDLGEDRVKLPEFSLYTDLTFEVQVRTVLQHAWAEIEHDRSYKFSGVLPTELQRRLYLIAGILEMVDREFNLLSKELDDYAKDVSTKTDRGDLDIEINTTSLGNFLPKRLNGVININLKDIEISSVSGLLIKELRDFGIHSLDDLAKIITSDFLDLYLKHQRDDDTTTLGFLRSAMMYHDIDKYFNKSWKEDHWQILDKDTYEMLLQKYGQNKMNGILSSSDIDLEEDWDQDDNIIE